MHFFKQLMLFVLILFLFITGCQRFEDPKEQTGLDKDSHSYSYMGYPDNKIKQSVQYIRGVKRVTTDYNGERITMHVYLNPSLSQNEVKKLKKEIRHRVNQAAPLNPVHIIIQQ